MHENAPESIYSVAPLSFFQQRLHDHLSAQTTRLESAVKGHQSMEGADTALQQQFVDLAERTRDDYRSFCGSRGVDLDTSALEQTMSDLDANMQSGLDNISSNLADGLGRVDNTMKLGFIGVAFLLDGVVEGLSEIQTEISDGFAELGASFDWGFSNLMVQTELQNQKLDHTIQILLRPVTTEARELLGKAKRDYRNGFMDEALESFLYLLEEKKYRVVLSTYFPIHILIADILLFFRNDYDGAIKYYESAIRYLPEKTEQLKALLLLHLARCYHLKGNNENARELATESRQVSYSREAEYQEAYYSALIGDTEAAMAGLESLLLADTDYAIRVVNERAFAGMKQQIMTLLARISLERLQRKLQRDRFQTMIRSIELEIQERRKTGAETGHLETLLTKLNELSNKLT